MNVEYGRWKICSYRGCFFSLMAKDVIMSCDVAAAAYAFLM